MALRARPHRLALVAIAAVVLAAPLARVASASALPPAGPVVLAPTGVEAVIWIAPEADGDHVARWASVPGGELPGEARAPGRRGEPLAIVLEGLLPGREIRGEVTGPGGRPAGAFAFRTAPADASQAPPADFAFAVLGRHAASDPRLDPPYRPASRHPAVLTAALARDPHFVLWVGGQASLRPADLDSPTSLAARWVRGRADPAATALLADTGHVVAPAAADLVHGDADGRWPYLPLSRRAFDAANPAPPVLLGETGPRVAVFRWADCAFFVLDPVTPRRDDPVPARREVLGSTQRAWLLGALRQVPATFKVLVSSRPLFNPTADPAHAAWAGAEHAAWLDELAAADIPGLLAISGGPVGEATKAVRARSRDLFEFVAGPSTAREEERTPSLNYFRLPATLATGPHFGWVTVAGPVDARVLTYTAVAPDGTELWKQVLPSGR